jgi:hypothetical protein
VKINLEVKNLGIVNSQIQHVLLVIYISENFVMLLVLQHTLLVNDGLSYLVFGNGYLFTPVLVLVYFTS